MRARGGGQDFLGVLDALRFWRQALIVTIHQRQVFMRICRSGKSGIFKAHLLQLKQVGVIEPKPGEYLGFEELKPLEGMCAAGHRAVRQKPVENAVLSE